MHTMTADTSPKTMTDRLVTLAEAAAVLRVHPETIRRAIRDGRVEGVRIWRSLRIRQSTLDRLMVDGVTGAR
jgi:excisionase family DNA binding protein